MAINQIYQLRLKQDWGNSGKALENVFFYQHTAGVSGAAQLANDFAASIADKINAIQGAVVFNKSIDVINLGDLGDFISVELLGQGSIAGECLPPQDAISYTFKLNTRAVRHGSKRFSGVPESVQSQGVVTDTDYIADMNALKIAMQQELVSADDTWLPVVLKRVRSVISGTSPVQYRYRLPESDGELVVGEIVTVLTTTIVKSQVTRKR